MLCFFVFSYPQMVEAVQKVKNQHTVCHSDVRRSLIINIMSFRPKGEMTRLRTFRTALLKGNPV